AIEGIAHAEERVEARVHARAEGVLAVEERARAIGRAVEHGEGPDAREEALGPEGAAGLEVVLRVADLRHEAGIGAEALAEILVLAVEVEGRRVVLGPD